MTEEDLKQIREIVRAEVAESETRMKASVAETEARMKASVAETEVRIRANQDRAAESFATDLVQVRTEINRRFDGVDRRLEAVERRLDRIADNTTALTRWADRLDKDNLQITSTQAAQQRAIDQLTAEVAEIKRRLEQRPEA